MIDLKENKIKWQVPVLKNFTLSPNFPVSFCLLNYYLQCVKLNQWDYVTALAGQCFKSGPVIYKISFIMNDLRRKNFISASVFHDQILFVSTQESFCQINIVHFCVPRNWERITVYGRLKPRTHHPLHVITYLTKIARAVKGLFNYQERVSRKV